MRERDTVWIHLEDKDRPGVVLEVQDDFVRLAYGTSSSCDDGTPCAVVHGGTRAGRKFPLTRTTYFYGANTALEFRGALRRGEAPCVRDLFHEIRRLVEEHDAAIGAAAEPDP
jgi:hypothetical protein